MEDKSIVKLEEFFKYFSFQSLTHKINNLLSQSCSMDKTTQQSLNKISKDKTGREPHNKKEFDNYAAQTNILKNY